MVPGTDPPAKSRVRTAALVERSRRQISIEREDALGKREKTSEGEEKKLRQLVSGGTGRKEASHHDEKSSAAGLAPLIKGGSYHFVSARVSWGCPLPKRPDHGQPTQLHHVDGQFGHLCRSSKGLRPGTPTSGYENLLPRIARARGRAEGVFFGASRLWFVDHP